MERSIETILLAARWLLLPLYLALLLCVLAVFVVVGRELLHLAALLTTGPETDILLILLSILDFVLVANLLVMVAVSSYESFISRLDAAPEASKPEWLGKMDSGNVKLKVAMAIVMISAIHLLRAFMNDATPERLGRLGAIQLVFVLAMLAMAAVERLAHPKRTVK